MQQRKSDSPCRSSLANFYVNSARPWPLAAARACGLPTRYETSNNKNDTLFADSGEMRPAECFHSLAKTRYRPAFSNTVKKQSGDDSPEKRGWDRFWNHRL